MSENRSPDPGMPVHERVLAGERLRSARRIAALRTLFVAAFYVRAVGWAWGLAPPWSTQQVLLTGYVLGAMVIWIAVRRSDRWAPASSLALTVFDLPMIFLILWPPFADASVERAADSLPAVAGAFTVVLFLSVLTIRRWQVVATGALALAFEGLLAAELDESATATTYALALTLAFLALGLYFVHRLNELVRSTAVEQTCRERLHRYFSPEVASLLERWPGGGMTETRTITVLFSDLKRFTPMSHAMTSDETVDLLNEVHGRMTRCVFDHEGTLDKFLGDGMLAYFNAPLDQPDHPTRAARCAIAMGEAIDELNAEREKAGLAPLDLSVGVHTGEATLGVLGPESRREYTAIGETVNVAAHVEKATRGTGDRILITASTRRGLDPALRLQRLPPTRVEGIEEPMELYRPLPAPGSRPPGRTGGDLARAPA